MLCQFTFKNYRSYRDEVELSMQATPMKEFERSLSRVFRRAEFPSGGCGVRAQRWRQV